jgi:hypothetical protein
MRLVLIGVASALSSTNQTTPADIAIPFVSPALVKALISARHAIEHPRLDSST